MFRIGRQLVRNRQFNWALGDQAVVSGCNFATGILLARFLGPETFGVFVLLQAGLIYANSFQGALILQPMMSAAPQFSASRRAHYLQGMLALQLLLSIALAVIGGIVVVAANVIFRVGGVATLSASVVVAWASMLLVFQLQDWVRRYYFVREKSFAAFMNDVLSYGGQVALLWLAHLGGKLDIANAFWIVAATSFTAFLLGMLTADVRPEFSSARTIVREGWRTGRDYLVAWQLQWIGSQGVILVGAGGAGAQAAGGVRTATNIVGPINMFFQAMENVVPVVAARRFEARGMAGLTSYLWKMAGWGTILLFPILAAMAIFSEPLMRIVYGAPYVVYAPLVAWATAAVLLQFYVRITYFFMRTVNATGVIVRTSAITAVCSIAVATITVAPFREVGVMIALIVGICAGLGYSLVAACKITRTSQSGVPDAGMCMPGKEP